MSEPSEASAPEDGETRTPSQDRRACPGGRNRTLSRSPLGALHCREFLLQNFPVPDAGDARRLLPSSAAIVSTSSLLLSVHRRTALFTPPIAIGIGVGWAACDRATGHGGGRADDLMMSLRSSLWIGLYDGRLARLRVLVLRCGWGQKTAPPILPSLEEIVSRRSVASRPRRCVPAPSPAVRMAPA